MARLARLARVLALASLLLGGLGGCASGLQIGPAQLPDRLTEHGVVVAEFYGFEGDRVHIDGKLRAYLHNNRLVLALAPGEYTLTGISRFINYGTSTSTTSLPVERPFEIKPGKVTNLGLILFDFDSLDYRKFYTYSLDNTASARRHLRASHPGLAATLGPDDFLSAPATYVAPDKLELLRKGLATRPSFYGKLKKADQDPRIVAGPAGIIAEHVVKDGKIVDIKVHETNTLSAAVDRSEHGEQNLIAMADGGLFLLSKGQLQALNAPADAAPLVRAELLPAGMLLVDERLRVFWTTDAGRSWARYTEAELAPTEATGDIHVAKGP